MTKQEEIFTARLLQKAAPPAHQFYAETFKSARLYDVEDIETPRRWRRASEEPTAAETNIQSLVKGRREDRGENIEGGTNAKNIVSMRKY